jgi:hypothetical protein
MKTVLSLNGQISIEMATVWPIGHFTETLPAGGGVSLRRGVAPGNLGGVNPHKAHDHPRWGFRRAYHAARAEGWYVNHKRLGSSTTPPPRSPTPNRVWAVDIRLASSCESRDLFS